MVSVQEANESMIKKLRYASLQTFARTNQMAMQVLAYPLQDLSEKEILLSHYYTLLQKTNVIYESEKITTTKAFLKQVRREVKKICGILNKYESAKRYKLRYLYHHFTENAVVIVLDLNLTYTSERARRYSKKDKAMHKDEKRNDVLDYLAVMFNESDKSARFRIKNPNNRFKEWLIKSLNLKEREEIVQTKWGDVFQNLLDNPNYEITEIDFVKTDINRRDQIIVRPTDPASIAHYVEQLKKAEILINPDISYIEKVKLRIPEGHTYTLKFKKENDVALKPTLIFDPFRDEIDAARLCASLGFNSGQIITDPQRDFFNEIFDDIGIKRVIKRYEIEKFPGYKIIDDFRDSGFLTTSAGYYYHCYACQKDFTSSKKKEKCKHCKLPKHIFYRESLKIKLDYEKIEKRIVALLRQNLTAKLRSVPLYSKKYDFIVVKKQREEAFIFFNKTGISKTISDDFLIDARPFVLADFTGELSSTLPESAHVRGGSILRAIKENNTEKIEQAISVAVSKFNETRISAIQQSVAKLVQIRDANIDAELTPSVKGSRFEKLVRPCFSLLFAAKHLGAKNRPDGVFFLNDNEYVLWDSKRYDSDKSKLKNQIKKRAKAIPKDLRYIRKAVTLDSVNKRNLRYYIFITKGVSKADFDSCNKYLAKLTRRSKINVKIRCMDLDALIALAESLCDSAIRSNIIVENERFKNELKQVLDNHNYIQRQEMTELFSKFKQSTIEPKMEEVTFTVSKSDP